MTSYQRHRDIARRGRTQPAAACDNRLVVLTRAKISRTACDCHAVRGVQDATHTSPLRRQSAKSRRAGRAVLVSSGARRMGNRRRCVERRKRVGIGCQARRRQRRERGDEGFPTRTFLPPLGSRQARHPEAGGSCCRAGLPAGRAARRRTFKQTEFSIRPLGMAVYAISRSLAVR